MTGFFFAPRLVLAGTMLGYVNAISGCAIVVTNPEEYAFQVGGEVFSGKCGVAVSGYVVDRRGDGTPIRWCRVDVNGFTIECEQKDCGKAIQRTLVRQEQEALDAQRDGGSQNAGGTGTAPPGGTDTPPGTDDDYVIPDDGVPAG